MGCTFFWVKFGNTFAYFVDFVYYPDIIQYEYLNNIQYEYLNSLFRLQDQTLPFSFWQAWKIYFYTRKFLYLQVILNDTNEQDTSFLDCIHKHMIKSGAPAEQSRSPAPSFTYRIPWFHKQN